MTTQYVLGQGKNRALGLFSRPQTAVVSGFLYPPPARGLVSSPALLSGTVVCPEGIFEFPGRARFERQRKFYRIEIHLLKAAGVACSCKVPVLGIEIPSNLDLRGNLARVSGLDAERANLIPARDIAPVVERVVFGLEVHQLRLDDDI